jgi:hypothetical protein
MLQSAITVATCLLIGCSVPVAGADPGTVNPGAANSDDVAGADPAADAAMAPLPADQPMPPAPDGRVESNPLVTNKSPDGWTLTVSAHDESQVQVPSLTDEAATREFIVGGVFNGTAHAPADADPPQGTFEVGYQIACGVDLSTGPGIAVGADIGILPGVHVTANMKPGIVNIIPVTKKQFKGADPWVMVSSFSIKIDGCVGKSFLRSYATLTKSTDTSDVIVSYYGVTKSS